MIDVIALAIKSGVIDSADINSVHIPEEYVADLTKFAHMAAAAERAEIIKILSIYASNLLELGAANSHHALQTAIEIIEELHA